MIFSPRTHPYLRLMRFDKPTGLWLLWWPCAWSVMLAWHAEARPGIPWATLLLFILGAAFMRAAGCIINDITDREIDRKVERTANRPLASGEVSVHEAVLLLVSLLWLSLIVAWMLGPEIVLLAALWLIPIVLYPWMKRLTWWPQAFLGLTFNAGALFGWIAVTGRLDWPAAILHLGAIGWTLGYDTIYAHQDKADDARIGVKSTARRLGTRTRPWLLGFYAWFAACLVACGLTIGVRLGFYFFLIFLVLQLFWQVATLRLDDRKSCWKTFRSNILAGGFVFAAAWCS